MPQRRAPSLAVTAALAAAGLAAGLLVAVVIATGQPRTDRVVWTVVTPLVGWSYVGVGLYAWRRRPEHRFGPLMVALGFAWLLQGLGLSDVPLPFTVGYVAGAWWGAVFIHLVLGAPSGRLATPARRAAVAAGYVVFGLYTLLGLLFLDTGRWEDCATCPSDVLQVADDPQLGETLWLVAALGGAVLCPVVIALLAARWRAASAPERRALLPVFLAGSVTGLAVVAQVIVGSSGAGWVGTIGFALTPFAFLGGIRSTTAARAQGVRGLLTRMGEPEGPGDLRAALARALGDPTLELAFRLPDGRYADADGRPVLLPAGDGPRVATEVEHDGRPIAALVHDRALCDDPEAVRAAGAAAALGLENRRLEAELRARVEELRRSRARLVEVGDAERRRLERDLHDGAQARFVALALQLRLARGEVPEGSQAAALLDSAGAELRTGLEELRELARGIHPAVLADGGLEAGLESLASRAPVPVTTQVRLAERPPAPVETAAYFIAAEALANVGKYAQASAATVRAERENGRLVVEVADDGVGGADPSAGSGLRGLAERVGALDGRLEVDSPPGCGTRVRAEIPLG